jgi:valyl-tRNA synthetase
MIEIDSSYDPKKYEKKWTNQWLEWKLFSAKEDQSRTPYTILMPPPNVTSQLHMGHGTCYTFMDLLIRWKRMQGFSACWLPGTDHAGIATQMMVERDLFETEGKRRSDLSREDFFARCVAWKDKYGSLIYQQFREIGFSPDWDRAAYTMDPELSEAVRYVFVKLFEEGLIYRGERLVNWDTVLQTAVSDDEVVTQEIQGSLWHLRYPIEGSDETITIATTRPETMLGDTAVAVNPDDERYKHLIGRQVRLPFVNRLIPIIGDSYVKSDFGTGALKITPAHDPNDFEIGKRHKLPSISILNDDGTIVATAPEPFGGKDRFVARKEVIRGLKGLGLFDKEQSYKHAVPHSDRSKSIIEPKLSKQWYVKMATLAEPAAAVAKNGELRFYPESWKKTYLYWLENIQDWCISRQLWWGHQLPIWYCKKCETPMTGLSDPTSCRHCGHTELRRDEDVLDTWFSSWLWPLSPFGWPNKEREKQESLEYFYPSQVLITAPEIIFLWVARMVMLGLKFKQEIPFRDIYFSATVTDKQGRKFSKTLGNGIDPLVVIDRHGADAVRFTGVSMAPLGGRIAMEESDFEAGARFVNKLWNAARFLLSHVDPNHPLPSLKSFEPDLPAKWLLTRLAESSGQINHLYENYRLNEGVEQSYHFIWGALCDWGVECAKPALFGEDPRQKLETLSVLVYVLDTALRLIHPVMPFVSEELWQKLPSHPDLIRPKSICIAAFPDARSIPSYQEDSEKWQRVTDLVSSVRSARQQVGISPKQQLDLVIKADSKLVPTFDAARQYVSKLANVRSMDVGIDLQRPAQSLSAVGKGFECFIPAEGLVDFSKESQRLKVEIERLSKIVDGLDKKLGNANYVDRAPADVVQQCRDQKQNLSEQIESLTRNLTALGHQA